MRIQILAAVAIGLSPAMAEARDGSPHVRVMRGSDAGTSWDASRDHHGMRTEHRDGRSSEYNRYPDYVGDGDYRYEDRDYAWSDRFDRDEYGDLGYERDYPYEHPYGGYGHGEMRSGYGYGGHVGGGYTVTETTVTTGPSVVHYIDRAEGVAVHRQKRTLNMKRGYRSGKRAYRAKAVPRCVC